MYDTTAHNVGWYCSMTLSIIYYYYYCTALHCIVLEVCMYGHTYSKSMDQLKSPARGQLNKKNEYRISLSAFVPENFVSRDGFGSLVPRQPAHLHTQAGSGAYLRDSSRVSRRRAFIHRSLPRVRRHGACKLINLSITIAGTFNMPTSYH